MTEPEIRKTRIAELLLEEIKTVIPLEMQDPRVVNSQVTRIQISPDMKTCRIFIIVKGTEDEKKEALAALSRASSYIRTQISVNLNLKYTPKFLFVYDVSFEKAQRIDDIVKGLHDKQDGTSP